MDMVALAILVDQDQDLEADLVHGQVDLEGTQDHQA